MWATTKMRDNNDEGDDGQQRSSDKRRDDWRSRKSDDGGYRAPTKGGLRGLEIETDWEREKQWQIKIWREKIWHETCDDACERLNESERVGEKERERGRSSLSGVVSASSSVARLRVSNDEAKLHEARAGLKQEQEAVRVCSQFSSVVAPVRYIVVVLVVVVCGGGRSEEK